MSAVRVRKQFLTAVFRTTNGVRIWLENWQGNWARFHIAPMEVTLAGHCGPRVERTLDWALLLLTLILADWSKLDPIFKELLCCVLDSPCHLHLHLVLPGGFIKVRSALNCSNSGLAQWLQTPFPHLFCRLFFYILDHWVWGVSVSLERSSRVASVIGPII